MLSEFSQDLRTCLCAFFMVSHISTNWPLKEALFKILCISSQRARTYTFSRGPQFWNKNCVLNYAVDYGYSFCVGTCWYVEGRGMKTRQMLLSVRKPGRMRIPEKAGGRMEGKGVIHQYGHQKAAETCSLSAPQRLLFKTWFTSDLSSSKCYCPVWHTFVTLLAGRWQKEPWT